MSSLNTIPVRIGLPFHGVVTGGQLLLPNGISKSHLQPSGQMTRLVRGSNRASLTRTTEQEILDGINGNAWQDHAYLSGSGLDIGGRLLGASKFLYNDGSRTWLLQYEIDPPASFLGETDPRYLIISIVGIFGEMALETRPTFSREIYRDRYCAVGEDNTYIIGASPLYTTTQTADGSKLLINCHAEINIKSLDDQPDFLVLYPWTDYSVSLGYAFYTVAVGDYWNEIQISGTGSTNTETIGSGITATLSSRAFYDNANGRILRTLSHAGISDMLYIDPAHWLDTVPYCELRRESDSGLLKVFSLDYANDQPNVGLKFFDGGLLDAFQNGEAAAIRVHPHEQSVAPDITGKTYDIANDTWHPGTGCIV